MPRVERFFSRADATARLRGAVASAAIAILGVLVLGVGAAGAEGRPDASRASHPAPAVATVQLGPLHAGAGFSAYVDELGCGGPDPTFEVTYLRTVGPAQLLHRYLGPGAFCQIQGPSAHPRTARLTLTLPGLINVSVTLDHLGRRLVHPGLPPDCGPPYGPELPARARGTVVLNIRPKTFGAPRARRLNAQVFPGAPQACPALVTASTPRLTAVIDADLLDVLLPSRGPAQLLLTAPDGDQPAPTLVGTTELRLTGTRAARSQNGTILLGSGSAFSRGSLSFTPLPQCPGATALNGDLAGQFEVDDPLLGPLRLVGADAQSAYLGSGSDQPGGCNGPGSQPVSPALITSCNMADSACSVAAHANTATIYDETSPGTQTIASESLNFGDGSAPVPIANYGSVDHTYAVAGTYTATVTVTTNTDQVSTATVPVVINP